jgi:glucarate dehydratase
MVVVTMAQFAQNVRQNAVQIILSDHHYWGGLRDTQMLARMCETFGLGLSMHSNSHLGISLLAMTHLAAIRGTRTMKSWWAARCRSRTAALR